MLGNSASHEKNSGRNFLSIAAIQNLNKLVEKYLDDDALIEQTVFFGRHDEVVRFVFVVDDVLEGDAELLIQVVEEVLLVHESNSGDLLNHGLGCRPSVPEVGGDGDGQLAAELLALETLKQKKRRLNFNPELFRIFC